MDEEPVSALNAQGGVARVGDTVRRPRHPRSGFVQDVLRHLEAVGFAGAPRPLGFDDEGREVVSFVEGEVFHRRPVDLTVAQLLSATTLVRDFHDAVSSSPLCGEHEVICHGDLGPHNTVFRGDTAVALIDWDADLAPGRRSADFADAAWGFADLTDRTVPVTEQTRRLHLMCDAYPGMTPAGVVTELAEYFRRARNRHVAAGRTRPAEVFDGLIAWTDANAPALVAEW